MPAFLVLRGFFRFGAGPSALQLGLGRGDRLLPDDGVRRLFRRQSHPFGCDE